MMLRIVMTSPTVMISPTVMMSKDHQKRSSTHGEWIER
jgi:hypothetical protein